jgi:hypothetical protein
MGDFAGTLLSGLTFQGSIQYDCGCVTGVGGKNSSDNIELFPNPVTGELGVVSPESGDKKIKLVEIYDMPGSRVLSRKPAAGGRKQLFIDVSYLNAGIYFARLLLDDGSVKQIKFVKE